MDTKPLLVPSSYAKLRNDDAIELLRRENPDPIVIILVIVLFLILMYLIYRKWKKSATGVWIDISTGQEYEIMQKDSKIVIQQSLGDVVLDGFVNDGRLIDKNGNKRGIITDRIILGNLKLQKIDTGI